MSDVTRMLNAIELGDAKATDELLPLVYEELRLLAAQAEAKPGGFRRVFDAEAVSEAESAVESERKVRASALFSMGHIIGRYRT